MKPAAIIWSLLLFSLTSCFRKEDPITLPVGNSIITSFSIGKSPLYEKEMFFDLGTNTYQERRWMDWDICFESSKDGYGVFINSGKDMWVRNINIYGLIQPLSVSLNRFNACPKLFDHPGGKVSLSAMGNWKNYNDTVAGDTFHGIYVCELNNKTGFERYKRIQIKSVNDFAYSVIITNLYDKNGDTIKWGKTIVIPKNPNQNFTYYSFDKDTIVEGAEPDKNTWDFVFTKYGEFYTGFPGAYSSAGVLSNTYKVEVARDSAVTNFEDIDKNSIPKYTFSTDRNVIGSDWKTWSSPGGSSGIYTIAPKLSFIIKDTDGQYYKLRFLEFYLLGEAGNPKFEFIKIK